jgi:hypothetical protein
LGFQSHPGIICHRVGFVSLASPNFFSRGIICTTDEI